MRAICQAIAAAATIDLTTHINPDADGIASMLALAAALRTGDRRVRCWSPSPVPARYAFLPGASAIAVAADADRIHRLPPCDLLIACDCADAGRLGALAARRRGRLVNLDHHSSNDRFGDLNLVDPRSACTAMIVERLLRALGRPLTPVTATLLYAGLVYDTGRFQHANTDAAAFRCAARLAAAGVEVAWVNRQLSGSLDEHDLALQAAGLARLVRDRTEPRLAGIALSAADIAAAGGPPEDWGDLVELPRSLRGVALAYLLREGRGPDGRPVVRCSLRSDPPVAVGPVAAQFGGGGHVQAAGCTIMADLATARRRLLPLLRAALR
jgi:phosphoesterase RecJ-like protein